MKAKKLRSKWCWMMDYCRTKGINPAFSFNWERAKRAWSRTQGGS